MKNQSHNVTSIFNRTFFVPSQQNTKSLVNMDDNKNQSHKSKKQKSLLERLQNQTIPYAKKPSQQKIITRQNTDQNSTSTFVQGVKTRSLTFEYYYKKVKQSQKKHKLASDDQQTTNRGQNLIFTKQYALNLNQQMLESMKKYIKRGEKNNHNENSGKYIEENTQYGLGIKGIETKKPQIQKSNDSNSNDTDILNVKEVKKYSMSSLLVIKKQQRYKTVTIEQSSEKQAQNGFKQKVNILKNKNIVVLQNFLCKKKSINNKTQQTEDKLELLAQTSDDNSIYTRFQGMIMNLNMILSSFRCVLILETPNSHNDLSKSQRRSNNFTYYIGYGNNKHLIRSIMKKRWWWSEVNDIKEANFIWTQLKVNDILDQVQINSSEIVLPTDKDILQDMKNQQKQSRSIEKSTLQTLNNAQISLKKKKKYLGQNNQYLKYLLRKENEQKLNWIFHQQTPLETVECNISKDKKQNTQNFSFSSRSRVVHNHYRLNYMFGNKNALFHNLKTYFEFMKNEEALYSFIPKTYYLEKTNKQGIKEFYQKQFLTSNLPGRKSQNLWIVKPAQNSNRGQGISVHTSFQSIRKEICSGKKNGKFIVQSYLRDLFLYQKRKFDIRVYVLMVTVGQTTKYFWYNEGYIRTSSQYYNTNDIDNVFIHLTNDAIQCDSEKYGKFEPGNKVSYSHFQRYLDSNYPKEKYSMQSLNSRMKSIATEAVRAIHPKIKSHRTQYTFELFGLDFLIDKSFSPWLLQINTNPCLQLGCPVLQRLIPRMLENMFRLCLDSVFQPCQQISKASSYFIYDNFFDINRFELVFDSNYDQNKDFRKYCEELEEKVYADDNEVFDNDGEEVDVEL